MSGYTVIASDMPSTSSINLQPAHVRWAWLYIITKQRDGVINDLTAATLMLGANLTLEQARDALVALSAPDPESKNTAREGRRLIPLLRQPEEKPVPNAYELVAFEDYSNLIKQTSNKRRQQSLREVTPDAELDGEFDVIWVAYPKNDKHIKPGKAEARKVYHRLRREGAEFPAILKGVTAYAKSIKADDRPDARKFVAHCRTFLNQKRYEDYEGQKEKKNEWS